MMLRRVSDGKITIADGGYLHGGRPLTGKLAAALGRLHAAGYLTVGARPRDQAGTGRYLPPSRDDVVRTGSTACCPGNDLASM